MGDSVLFEPTRSFSVLASLPLGQFNVDISDFEVEINMTKLLNDGGRLDQDIQILVSDGRNLFGGLFHNISSRGDELFLQSRRSELLSDGQSVEHREIFNPPPFGVSVPADTIYTATIGVRAEASETFIIGRINNGALDFTASTTTTFNSGNGGPSLILASYGPQENHLINSVTFTRGVSAPAAVPEPGALGGMLLGLTTLGFGLCRRRVI